MQLQKSPNRWSCLPTALAMTLSVDLSELIDLIGHDGSEILWPDQPEPLKRRGFHIEELQYVAVSYGFLLVPFSPRLLYNPKGDPDIFVLDMDFTGKFKIALDSYDGILLGEYKTTKNAHAIAWCSMEGTVYDPSGHTSKLNDFEPECFYAAIRFEFGSSSSSGH